MEDLLEAVCWILYAIAVILTCSIPAVVIYIWRILL